MVEGRHDEDVPVLNRVGVAGGSEKSPQRGVDGREIVHASSSDELLAGAKDLTALGIGSNEVEGSDVFRGDA